MSSLSFASVVLHPSLPTGRISATITVNSRSLDVSWPDGTLSLPFEGLQLHYGGANTALLFISHPAHPEWSVFTREKGLVRSLAQVAGDPLHDNLKALSNSRRSFLRTSVIALGCLALIIWSLFALKDPIIDLVAQVIPRSWERKLGDVIYMGVRAQSSIIDDSDLDRNFQTLISPLMSAVKDTGYTFDFHIAKDQDLNAFALPGGIIVVHAGTILQSDRPEELLGVLAHELSHVTCRHTTKQAITVFGLYFIVDVVLGNVFGTVAALSQGAFYLLQQGFSREHEQEADLEGLKFLQKANVDPMGVVEFFGKLKTEYEKVPMLGELERSLSFLSTHPATDDRITYLTEKIRESGTTEYKPLSKSDLEAFKVKLRAKL